MSSPDALGSERKQAHAQILVLGRCNSPSCPDMSVQTTPHSVNCIVFVQGQSTLAGQFRALSADCPPDMRYAACALPHGRIAQLNSNIQCADGRHTVYVSEIRRAQSTLRNYEPAAEARDSHPKEGERRWRKSWLQATMRERAAESFGLDGRDMLYWDDYSEGTFIGGDQAGYKLHVDCIQSSNVGTLHTGHKLLAIWGYPQPTMDVVTEHLDTHFVPPLGIPQLKALQLACKVVLAPPGSVYLFSGCNAHVVCNVGWTAPSGCTGVPERCVTIASYEALCGLHPRHVRALAGTHDSSVHNKECWMDTSAEIEDFEEDVAFNVNALRRRARTAA